MLVLPVPGTAGHSRDDNRYGDVDNDVPIALAWDIIVLSSSSPLPSIVRRRKSGGEPFLARFDGEIGCSTLF